METRARLLNAGINRFSKHGVRGSSSADIAEDAGVAVGTLYTHFEDKEALLACILDEAHDDYRSYVERDGLALLHDPPALVRRMIESTVEWCEKNLKVARIFFHPEVLGTASGEAMLERVMTRTETLIGAGRALGIFRADIHPGVASRALLGMQLITLRWWLKNPDRLDREELIDQLAAIRLNGFHP
ncbi:MAG: AcrR family transcriptional regulator [Myxococcota bacterium]|jgi:AcrR family transcriptional regulator